MFAPETEEPNNPIPLVYHLPELSVTMAFKLRCTNTKELPSRSRVAGNLAMVALLSLAAGTSLAQESGVHYLHHGVMPPGAIGSRQLQRGGPLPGFFQPVEIRAPAGALVSLAVAGRFDQPQPAPLRAGLLIGQVYRLRVMNIPLNAGREVFPTIEVIDRLYAPPDQQRRFAIPVQLAQQDLQMALDGKFVTRVIYLEDPRSALPVREDPKMQNWFDIGPRRDPLAVADSLGRPVAILRLGARLPLPDEAADTDFLFGCPPWTRIAAPGATGVPPVLPGEQGQDARAIQPNTGKMPAPPAAPSARKEPQA